MTEPAAESIDGWPEDPGPDDPSPVDLPNVPEVPDWGGWMLDNLDKVLLALIVLWLISTFGPGLAETAQAAGGDG